MVIFVICDRTEDLNTWESAVRKAVKEADVMCFSSGDDALRCMKDGPCDVAFIDIEREETAGFEFALNLKRLNPKVNLIFVTDRSEYSAENLTIHASGYLQKPVTEETVKVELSDLRYPVAQLDKQVRFQTFGDFEVYADGNKLKFQRPKSKEFLAYLVDRGTLCTNEEIMAALWPNGVSSGYLRHLRIDVLHTFQAAGCENILVKERNRQGILTDMVSCDYYDWKKNFPGSLDAYHGEYMAQYSWAETTHALIEEAIKNMRK